MFRILVVEDDAELRELFRQVLGKNGYQAVGAADGVQALDALDNDYYDLIISDVMMPVMDGYELVRQLRDKGAFHIQRSVPYVAERLGVTKFTVYNYLNEINNE